MDTDEQIELVERVIESLRNLELDSIVNGFRFSREWMNSAKTVEEKEEAKKYFEYWEARSEVLKNEL